MALSFFKPNFAAIQDKIYPEKAALCLEARGECWIVNPEARTTEVVTLGKADFDSSAVYRK